MSPTTQGPYCFGIEREVCAVFRRVPLLGTADQAVCIGLANVACALLVVAGLTVILAVATAAVLS